MGRESRLKRNDMHAGIKHPEGSSFPPPRVPWSWGKAIGDQHLLSIGASIVIFGVRVIIELTPFALGLGAARAPGMFAVRALVLLFNVAKVRRA